VTYRVVIPTAGIGSRLENKTKNLNKSLVSISNKPILSHLIDQFPYNTEFVIALGYKGQLVRDYLELAYPKRTFFFVKVDPFKGNGSGLGYSLLCCKKFLQQPFIFSSCDTLVKEEIPKPSHDWMGYSGTRNLSLFRTLEIKKKNIFQIHEKKKTHSKNEKAYIGLAGINDYLNFWEVMSENSQKAIKEGEVYGLKNILDKGVLKAHKFKWFDTGNLKNLTRTQKIFKSKGEPNILEKENEAIWIHQKKIIKFSTDPIFIKNRYKRSKILKNFVPDVFGVKKNMYIYTRAEGQVFSNVINLSLFKNFLDLCENFWKKKKLNTIDREKFEDKCYQFYHDKTITRIKEFFKNFKKKDKSESINRIKTPKIEKLLKQVDWKDLSNGQSGSFHGDFHFENILWQKDKRKFVFLDWRQDFCGNLQVGDIYYDLAKLLHGMIVSHEMVQKNDFWIKWTDKKIVYKFKRKKILKEVESQFRTWCINKNYSFSKIKILTAIIFLNIASLHHYPYSLFLFALGKDMLKKEIDN
jgi:NDP-sugar pyrophosphorylase family protein